MNKGKWFFAVLALAAVIAGVWYYTSDDEDDDEDEEVSEFVTMTIAKQDSKPNNLRRFGLRSRGKL